MVSLEGVKLLGEQDSHKFASLVLGSSSNFVSRDEGLSTFGAASYIDCPDEKSFALLTGERGRINREQNYQKYLDLSAKLNPGLWAAFEDIYLKLLEFFASILEAEVVFAAGKALPGFHVYRSTASNASQRFHIPHFDAQYKNLVWPESFKEPMLPIFPPTISFTLPLSLPGVGGNLRYWDWSYKDQVGLAKNEIVAALSRLKPKICRYEPGSIVVHDGHVLHQIEAWPAGEGVCRITMQGHGIFLAGKWHIYW
jgi:hypothetical protein